MILQQESDAQTKQHEHFWKNNIASAAICLI